MGGHMDFSHLEGYMDKIAGVEVLYQKAYEVSKLLSDKYSFVEVGSWRGGSAVAIMQAIKDSGSKRWLFTIDPYGSKPFHLGKKIIRGDHYHEEDYRHAMKFMSNYAFDNKINHCHFRMTFNDFLDIEHKFWYLGKEMDLTKIGFAYLDGEHTPDNVNLEFRFFDSIITNGGAIVIDDFPYWEGKYEKLDKLIHECPKDNFRVYYDKN